MKFKFLKTAIISCTLLLNSFAQAGLIRTTMDLTITNVNGYYSTVAKDDVFRLSVVYDDASTYMQNRDDTHHCLTSHIAVAGVTCQRRYDEDRYDFFSDALFNAHNMFDLNSMNVAGGYFYDRDTFQRSMAWKENGTVYMRIDMDELSTDVLFDGRVSSVFARWYYKDRDGVERITLINFITSNHRSNKVDVPEPSTLAIFALGMIGLASRRFKKQS